MSAERATFAPYQVVDSGRSVDEIFAQVNEAVYYGYGPDYRYGGRNKVIAGPAHDFVTLLEGLCSIGHVRFVEHWRLVAEPCPPDVVRIAFRHDIDSDIVAAIQQAEIQRDYGVAATWLVLHTAPYYGMIDPETKVFHRHDSMIEVYKRLQEFGHEVSIHTDPLGLYQFHGIDGASGFTTELEWMRSHDIVIRGTTAHNFRPTYGAENYEAFKDYVSPRPNAQPVDAEWVNHNGAEAPLRVLDGAALGLEYEGNQALWTDPEPHYGAIRYTNLWRWAEHDKRRRRDPEGWPFPFVDQESMLDEIRRIEPGRDVVLVIHPEYYGARSGPAEAPPLRLDVESIAIDGLAGSATYEPHSVVAKSRSDTQSVNIANEIGMLDLPIGEVEAVDLCVGFVGSTQFDAAHLPVHLHAHRRFVEAMSARTDLSVDAVKLAHPGLSVDRLMPWLVWLLDERSVDVVVIGLDSIDTGVEPAVHDLVEYVTDRGASACLVAERGQADERRLGQLADMVATIVPSPAESAWTIQDHARLAVSLVEALDSAPDPAAEAQVPPSKSSTQAAAQRRRELGLCDYPTPFSNAVAIVSDTDGSNADSYERYRSELVDRAGLDFGDSVHLADFHHRSTLMVAEGGLSLLQHDLRRPPAQIDQRPHWFGSALGEYHLGNLDHLHGLYAFGARCISLTPQRAGRRCRLVVPNPSSKVPLRFDVTDFPIDVVAVETTCRTVPDSIDVIEQRRGIKRWIVPSDPQATLRRSLTRPTSAGTWISVFARSREPMSVTEHDELPSPLVGRDDVEVLIDCRPDDIVSAALHNADTVRASQALRRLDDYYGVVFDLLTAHGQFHFYTKKRLNEVEADVEQVVDEFGDGVALYGSPSWAGLAGCAVFDHPDSPARIARELTERGIRYLTPCGYISSRDACFDPLEAVFPVIDGQGGATQFFRRTMPNPAWPLEEELQSRHSRLSSFESRLRRVLDRVEAGERGVWPIYTHLGQTKDLGASPPGDWFPHGTIHELADRYFGFSGVAERVWFTRASVLAGYCETLRELPARTARVGDRIEVTAADDQSSANHLFGISFEVDDPCRASVAHGGREVPLVRWKDDGRVTCVPCPIVLPVVAGADPVAVAAGGAGSATSDLANASTARGQWSWSNATPGRAPFGTLGVESGVGEFEISLGGLRTGGCQVVRLRVRHSGADSFRLEIEGDDGYCVGFGPGPRDEIVRDVPLDGWFDCGPVPPTEWCDLYFPLWGPQWALVPAELDRTARRLTVVVQGHEATLDLSHLEFLRPRGLRRPTPAPRVGGVALGVDSVLVRSFDVDELHECEVEPDGVFASPDLVPGVWCVSGDGGPETIVNVGSSRFDLRI